MINKKFNLTCQMIEANENFKSDCTPKQLLDLVVKDGVSIYTPRKHALAITNSEENCELGRLYKVLMTSYGSDDLYPASTLTPWRVESLKLLVDFSGTTSFYSSDSKDFSEPLKNIDLAWALNHPCLHNAENKEIISR